MSRDATAPVVAVLEDDADTRELYDFALTSAGYTVVPASTGAELLSLLRTQEPDALVMDLGLPDTQGVPLCRMIRTHQKYLRLPIIAVTGWSSGPYVQGLGDAPFNEVFLKPVPPALLVEALRRWVR